MADKHGVAAADHWIGLLDAAEALRRAPNAYQPATRDRVSRAIADLLTYEHTLPAHVRRLVRERLWLRDRAAPLPDLVERERWDRCDCPICQRQRLLAGPARRSAWQSQAAAVAAQHDAAPPRSRRLS